MSQVVSKVHNNCIAMDYTFFGGYAKNSQIGVQPERKTNNTKPRFNILLISRFPYFY